MSQSKNPSGDAETIPSSEAAETNGQWSGSGERDQNGRFVAGHSHRWKAGQSGNPAGGRVPSLTEILRRQLQQADPYKPEQSIADSIAEGLLYEARLRNIQAIREVFDRIEGKPRQQVEMDMRVSDWRTLAESHGLADVDVIEEARQLIESADFRSDTTGDTETQ